ncbi:MAG: DUF1624 domain-containing protein [Rhizobium sp.]|nr:DUF1624 domain-containing protein [Rhizobium sp.]
MTDAETTKRPSTGRRLLWLDIARGVALLAMASYHFIWDLSSFGYLEPGYAADGWPRIYARSIASTFLFLAGFSLVLAHGERIRWRSFWKRWLVVAGAAFLVTVASYFAIPQGLIHFGILHAIAAASVVGLLFLRLPVPVTLLAAIAAFVAPFYLKSDAFNAPWFWWIGLSTMPRPSFDYVPMLPWLAAVLAGIGAARLFPSAGALRQNAPGDKPPGRSSAILSYLGRHSLVFYLVHQPVLIAILYGVSLAYPATGHPDAFTRSCVAACLPQASEAFCGRYCACALDRLEREELLAPLQSGAMPDAYRGNIDTIRSQCTVEAQAAGDDFGN